MSKFIPNSFQTPNAVVDDLMNLLTGSELKVLLFTIRHIFGWQDKIALNKAPISLSMYTDGYGDFAGVGLGRPTVVKALNALTEYQVLIKVGKPTNRGQVWSIGDNPDIEGLRTRNNTETEKLKGRMKSVRSGKASLPVKPINQNQLSQLTSSGKANLPNKTQDKTQDKEKPLPPVPSGKISPSDSITAVNPETVDAKPKPKTKKSKSTPAGDNFVALSEVIPDLLNVHYGAHRNIAHMLSGTATKGVYKEHAQYFQDENMVTVDELKAVVAFYRKQYPDGAMLKRPEAIADWVGKYRASQSSTPQLSKADIVAMNTPYIPDVSLDDDMLTMDDMREVS